MNDSNHAPGQERHPLDVFFSPRTVALIGASETPESVGRTIMSNLLNNSFSGQIFPVNSKRKTVLGKTAYPTITAIRQKVDLAVIATPAPTVPGIIAECAQAGVRGAIIISAGFKELGEEVADLERQILSIARASGMRLIGPDCLGLMNPSSGLNATFAGAMAQPGNVAFLSQSGALCTAILDWSLRELVGFSSFVSVGSMLDVQWGDLIDYLGDDPATKSILIYMESIGDARRFLSAAREVALKKPIIIIKAGRTESAAKAATSHTGAMTGSDEVIDAAFRRVGVLRVNNIADLFYMAEVLARQPRPMGPRLTIVTNAGGPGVLATDALIEAGGELSMLAPATMQQLNETLPPHWSRGNPIDILGDAGPQRYARTMEIVAADPNSDGMLVILTPQDMTNPTDTAQALACYAKCGDKPVLASWMGGPTVQAGEAILNHAGIPTFPYPDTAARAFQYMWRYTYNLRGIYETPAAIPDAGLNPAAAADIILAARAASRTLLDEDESKRLLASYGIPVVRTQVATTPDAATLIADTMGYPVVVKLFSRTISHKTDVGGVKLNLATAGEVRAAFSDIQQSVATHASANQFEGVTVQPMVRLTDAYELILGSNIDPQFGPVLLFGAGGQLVEVFKDRSLALPPLNATLARRMMEQTRIYKALHGVRGRKPIDLGALEQLLVRFSRLVLEQPRIKEIDINPLAVSPGQIIALDARVVLFPADTPEAALPRPAIRPYPTQYVTSWTMKDGSAITIRPIRPDDEPLVAAFHATLSERSVELRYFHLMKFSHRVAHDRLTRVCFNDYDREIALVAERRDPISAQAEILGITRLNKSRDGQEAEVAVLISDKWQHQGLGTQLVNRAMQVARAERIRRVAATVMGHNTEMQAIFEGLGFKLSRALDDGTVTAVADNLSNSPD